MIFYFTFLILDNNKNIYFKIYIFKILFFILFLMPFGISELAVYKMLPYF